MSSKVLLITNLQAVMKVSGNHRKRHHTLRVNTHHLLRMDFTIVFAAHHHLLRAFVGVEYDRSTFLYLLVRVLINLDVELVL